VTTWDTQSRQAVGDRSPRWTVVWDPAAWSWLRQRPALLRDWMHCCEIICHSWPVPAALAVTRGPDGLRIQIRSLLPPPAAQAAWETLGRQLAAQVPGASFRIACRFGPPG